ncbi:MAG TPA: NAD(+) diphosphatase [Methylomusa anaerophila]|uniref:NAD(+) diphosphatase n=1 Tax=Methylomusa anaerophila TaxID=1930071 RepID=A0A348AIV0_9FIRM|nr:NAD(+) diphosphatase [Methylomusa anaerophila]BBB90998.1 NADH pyrophosphatase [Methylomusa anaerophila]HML88869.1 NAD(+) diphosphatase [Methylomusa anaerophila]
MDFKVSEYACENAYWFLFYNDELLVEDNAGIINIPLLCDTGTLNLELADAQYIGSLAGHKCYAVNLRSRNIPPGFSFKRIRQLYGQQADLYFWFTARAFHIINWLKNNRFCGCCGSKMHGSSQGLAVRCPHCSHIVYPRISPAIIVAVLKDDKILLARSTKYASMYSVIAGFVEPGETLEECVKRELKEEVGIEVTNIRYFGNQPWPFPDSLMIAFTAQYARGKITVDNDEIVDAGWFSAHDLPDIPSPGVIARQLIDWFVARCA